MPEPGRVHRSATTTMSVLMLVIGIALIVRTLAAGGGPVATGVLLGALFAVAGAVRLWAQTRGQ
jgi:hypothetical protein